MNTNSTINKCAHHSSQATSSATSQLKIAVVEIVQAGYGATYRFSFLQHLNRAHQQKRCYSLSSD